MGSTPILSVINLSKCVKRGKVDWMSGWKIGTYFVVIMLVGVCILINVVKKLILMVKKTFRYVTLFDNNVCDEV